MALNDVYRTSNIFTHPEGDGELIFTRHYRTTTVNTMVSGVLEATDIATELLNNIEVTYLPTLAATFTFVETVVIGITDPTVQFSLASGFPGQAGTEAVALRSAPVVKLGTGLRGRSFNGRMFLMAVTEDRQTGGVLSAPAIAEIDSLMGFIRRLSINVNNNVYDSTIFSLTLSTPPAIIVDTLINSEITNATMGSQRGRQVV